MDLCLSEDLIILVSLAGDKNRITGFCHSDRKLYGSCPVRLDLVFAGSLFLVRNVFYDFVHDDFTDSNELKARERYAYYNGVDISEIGTPDEDDFKELKGMVEKIENTVKNWKSLMKVVYDFLFYINEKSMAGISTFNELVEVVVGGAIKMTINELLMRLKEFLVSTGDKVSDYIEIFKGVIDKIIKIAEDLKISFDSFKEENPKIIEKINNSIKKFADKLKIAFPILEPFSEEILKSIHKVINFVTTIFTGIKSKIEDFTGIFNVEVSTSLDLLFIMDITGSMGPYITDVKNNLLNIIDGIVKECPGININIGYIGYRDYFESYIDIDFTKILMR